MIADGPCADPGKPSGARVYDFLIGGKDNLPADRELAAKLIADDPGLPQLSLDNRAFVLKSARWVASIKGIAQFIDAGCGLPGPVPLHRAVRDAGLPAKVAYADKDPIVLSHLAATQAAEGWEGTAVIKGDAEDPESVLGDPALTGLIDLEQPAALIFGATLSCMDAETARDAVAGFTARLAPRSAVIISCTSYFDQERGDAMAAAYASACNWRSHPVEDVQGFFGDLRLVGGIVADVRHWLLLPDAEGREARVLGGVGLLD